MVEHAPKTTNRCHRFIQMVSKIHEDAHVEPLVEPRFILDPNKSLRRKIIWMDNDKFNNCNCFTLSMFHVLLYMLMLIIIFVLFFWYCS